MEESQRRKWLQPLLWVDTDHGIAILCKSYGSWGSPLLLSNRRVLFDQQWLCFMRRKYSFRLLAFFVSCHRWVLSSKNSQKRTVVVAK